MIVIMELCPLVPQLKSQLQLKLQGRLAQQM